jgi:hypothetical protein
MVPDARPVTVDLRSKRSELDQSRRQAKKSAPQIWAREQGWFRMLDGGDGWLGGDCKRSMIWPEDSSWTLVQMSRVSGATRLNILCMPRHIVSRGECLSRQPRSAVDECSTCAQPECVIIIESVRNINSSYSYGDLASFILTYSQIVFLFCLKI